MKIGQLTFHGSHNYGSVLQAYALSTQLRTLGHEPEIINLRPQTQKDYYKIFNNRDIIHKAFTLMIYPKLKRRFTEYERFISGMLPLSQNEFVNTNEIMSANLEYDAYICGGDQIWNPACQDFEPAYYLAHLADTDTVRRISYAPSFGKTEFDQETFCKICNWVRRFDFISVRETRGAELIRACSSKPVHVVCDPVLLLNRDDWEKIAIHNRFRKPYILAYFLSNNHGGRNLIPWLEKETGYDVVILNEFIRDYFSRYHKAIQTSPKEFVGLLLDASLIYTNSFHGTAFATLLNKPFYTSVASDQDRVSNNSDSRKIDFLKLLGLESRIVGQVNSWDRNTLSIDFRTANIKLNEFITSSLAYLVQSLE